MLRLLQILLIHIECVHDWTFSHPFLKSRIDRNLDPPCFSAPCSIRLSILIFKQIPRVIIGDIHTQNAIVEFLWNPPEMLV